MKSDLFQTEDLKRARRLVGYLESFPGRSDWWPGDTDEVMIGAVLTQQTRWENVELALDRLKEAGIETITDIYRRDEEIIQDLIRCTGFYRVKTRRLRNLATRVVEEYGSTGKMAERETAELRRFLLDVPGIGEETADSILCYGFSRPCFVVDAYTERICRCAGIVTPRRHLKELFESVLPDDNGYYRMTHARFVEFAKCWCSRCRSGNCMVTNLRV
ncbi:MAG: endonuclease III domain-containing protein [Methanoculleaceae archaeon]